MSSLSRGRCYRTTRNLNCRNSLPIPCGELRVTFAGHCFPLGAVPSSLNVELRDSDTVCLQTPSMYLLEKLGLVRRRDPRLVILDDIFPHLLSAFRIAEFNAYLSRYPNSVVHSTAVSFSVIGDRRSLK